MIIDLPSTTTGAVGRKLVDLRDTGGAIALGRVLTDDALAARLGRAGREFAQRERTWDASLAGTWRALAEL